MGQYGVGAELRQHSRRNGAVVTGEGRWRTKTVQVTSATPEADGARVLVEGGVWESFTTGSLILLICQMGTRGCFMGRRSEPSETTGTKHLLRVWVRARLRERGLLPC